MIAARPAEILRHLEQSGAADADLLARFVASGDAGAFAELVRRHGAPVLGVCRRVTGHQQDAEDAFQATFLVLARKAGTLRNAVLLGNWLYGVAYRVARRAKRAAARRRTREVAVAALPEPLVLPAPLLSELMPILDEELAALPSHYRDAIVLCDIRGASREEAAAALGVPEGTLSSRLANGRKKLAARLTKRGIALSVAVLPLALSEAQTATTFPNELVMKTCGLVAEFAASGAVPGPLARLIEGGLAVRKALAFSVLMGVAVAGAVFASQPREAPPVDPPKPPAVAGKSEAQPKVQPDVKAEVQAVAFAATPKMQLSFDIGISMRSAMWNATGTRLAVFGREPIILPGGGIDPKKTQSAVSLIASERGNAPSVHGYLADNEGLAWVSPDGLSVVAQVREYQLISGNHQLKVKGIKDRLDPGAMNFLRDVQSIDLDLPETHGHAFAADGKTFRTVAYHRGAGGEVTKIEVIEVDAATGKAGKPLVKLDYGRYALSANGKRVAVLNKGATAVTVYDVDRRAKVSEHTFSADKPDTPKQDVQAFLVFSPDGKRLIVTRGLTRSSVLNADTGEALPELEGTATASLYPDTHAFTGDGRLLAAICTPYTTTTIKSKATGREQTVWKAREASVVTVWDTQTGKALKTWNSAGGVRVAFNPARPLLAILEPNGENNARVGFWDFAAEAEKK